LPGLSGLTIGTTRSANTGAVFAYLEKTETLPRNMIASYMAKNHKITDRKKVWY
jgi:hypothetical protein